MTPAFSKIDETETAIVLSDTVILSLMRAVFTTGKRDSLLGSYLKPDDNSEAVVFLLSKLQRDLFNPFASQCLVFEEKK